MRLNIKMRLSITLSGVACAALLLAGCGNEASPHAVKAQADVGVLAEVQGVGGNYARSDESPAELASAVPVALTGTIDRIAPGLTIVASDAGDNGQVRSEHAIVRVRIDHVYKSDGVGLGTFAFVAIPLGAQSTDLSGKPLLGGSSTIKPISDLQKGLPSGTRVVVAAYAFPDADPGTRHLNADAGAEPGEPLLYGYAPQSFSVEDGTTRRLSGWDSLTYEDAVQGLQKSFG